MIKVFIIDDSVLVRNSFKKILRGLEDIEVLGEADNPVDAFTEFKKVGLPDVFILDIEMPKMDGLTFLRKINVQRPTPVIMCSTLVTKGSAALLEALSLGAFAIIAKPKVGVSSFINDYKEDVLEYIRSAAKAKIRVSADVKKTNTPNITKTFNHKPSTKIIAIGSSTGGVQVIEEILTNLQKNHPPILIVQHMPLGFTANFATRLDGICENSHVVEAQEGDILKTDRVYIAPGAMHMEVVKEGLYFVIRLKDFPRVDFHKPSITVFLTSISKVAKENATAFILTGMGVDGAAGLLKMREVGSKTYCQNEQTSTVYGMPKAAVGVGAVISELSIFDITKTINGTR